MTKEKALKMYHQMNTDSMDGISPEISAEHFISMIYEKGYVIAKPFPVPKRMNPFQGSFASDEEE